MVSVSEKYTTDILDKDKTKIIISTDAMVIAELLECLINKGLVR
jgi:hypothetical protein